MQIELVLENRLFYHLLLSTLFLAIKWYLIFRILKHTWQYLLIIHQLLTVHNKHFFESFPNYWSVRFNIFEKSWRNIYRNYIYCNISCKFTSHLYYIVFFVSKELNIPLWYILFVLQINVEMTNWAFYLQDFVVNLHRSPQIHNIILTTFFSTLSRKSE